jgi:hypothetical protein
MVSGFARDRAREMVSDAVNELRRGDAEDAFTLLLAAGQLDAASAGVRLREMLEDVDEERGGSVAKHEHRGDMLAESLRGLVRAADRPSVRVTGDRVEHERLGLSGAIDRAKRVLDSYDAPGEPARRSRSEIVQDVERLKKQLGLPLVPRDGEKLFYRHKAKGHLVLVQGVVLDERDVEVRVQYDHDGLGWLRKPEDFFKKHERIAVPPIEEGKPRDPGAPPYSEALARGVVSAAARVRGEPGWCETHSETYPCGGCENSKPTLPPPVHYLYQFNDGRLACDIDAASLHHTVIAHGPAEAQARPVTCFNCIRFLRKHGSEESETVLTAASVQPFEWQCAACGANKTGPCTKRSLVTGRRLCDACAAKGFIDKFAPGTTPARTSNAGTFPRPKLPEAEVSVQARPVVGKPQTAGRQCDFPGCTSRDTYDDNAWSTKVTLYRCHTHAGHEHDPAMHVVYKLKDVQRRIRDKPEGEPVVTVQEGEEARTKFRETFPDFAETLDAFAMPSWGKAAGKVMKAAVDATTCGEHGNFACPLPHTNFTGSANAVVEESPGCVGPSYGLSPCAPKIALAVLMTKAGDRTERVLSCMEHLKDVKRRLRAQGYVFEEAWGPSGLCSDGKHEWCANRSAEESHCTCVCHKPAKVLLDGEERVVPRHAIKVMGGKRHIEARTVFTLYGDKLQPGYALCVAMAGDAPDVQLSPKTPEQLIILSDPGESLVSIESVPPATFGFEACEGCSSVACHKEACPKLATECIHRVSYEGKCEWCARDHREHGSGNADDGPDDPDCPCRTTPLQRACEAQGCGFCRATASAEAHASSSFNAKPKMGGAAFKLLEDFYRGVEMDKAAAKLGLLRGNKLCDFTSCESKDTVTEREEDTGFEFTLCFTHAGPAYTDDVKAIHDKVRAVYIDARQRASDYAARMAKGSS